ncbi:hypothetical protein pEaSNUABM57_00034 [Erwinia phage pEa_SNUABM_57]|uniref:Inhibitor of host toxin/antitoxin system n=1 Tax=Erwinia phage pEa_SNUABM_57 TaxID=2996118 RepID=A0A9E9BZ90_9CAUD|nr:hypothetical protein pEaSNUABM57_00034 [Erwinia phage pEa_SNUABM_57]
MSKHANTIRLSDTIDQYSRRVHINTRGEKVTLVLRWKDSKSHKNRTQRVTLDDAQTGRLMGALTVAADKVIDKDDARLKTFGASLLAPLEKAGHH